MACIAPMKGYSSRSGQWCKEPGWPGAKPMTVPCGDCIGCGVDRVNEWTVRNLHEWESHEHASFITLTYDDQSLPHVAVLRGGEVDLRPTLVPSDLQKFWKRFRKKHKIRYFACGEYGDVYQRPHYHAIVYGYDFPDKTIAPDQNGSLDVLYTSVELSELWPFGFNTVGAVTRKSIEYVARYTLKRKTRRHRLDERDPRVPLFGTQSRNPGLGGNWIERWRRDVYPSDTVVIDGQERRPPRYYDDVVLRDHPELILRMRADRMARAEVMERDGHFAWLVLEAKKAVYEGQLKFKRRGRNG